MALLRSRRRLTVATFCLLALLVAGAVWLAPAPGATATTSNPPGTQLAVSPDLGDTPGAPMGVDFTHQIVLVAAPQDNVVSFLNYSGQVLGTLTVNYPAGIVMSPDDADAYLAFFDGVDEIDMQTMRVVATIPAPPGLFATHVALAGGRLWTEMKNSGVGQPPYTGDPIYSSDLADPGAGFTYSGVSEPFEALLASPSPNSDELFAGLDSSSPSALDLYSISGTTLTTIASNDNYSAYVVEASFTADGSMLYLPCSPAGAPYSICGFQMPNLTTPVVSFSIGDYIGGLAVTPDGSQLLVAKWDPPQGPDTPAMLTYRPGDPSAQPTSYPTGALRYGDLVMSPDESLVFAVEYGVVNNSSLAGSYLHIYVGPGAAGSTPPSTTTTGATTTVPVTTTTRPGSPTTTTTLPTAGSPSPPTGTPPVAPPAVSGHPDAGYYEVASDGGIFAFGGAQFYGSTGSIHLNEPIVGMARTPDGGGYWLVASDGGIFAFGDAQFYGSTGAMHLNEPIVGMARTSDGGGYWLVASDGGIFAFGDAQFYGSTGAMHLNEPVIGMAATPDGDGYWLAAADGGVFSFGDADFQGSGTGSSASATVGIAADASGGYWIVDRDGTVSHDGAHTPTGIPVGTDAIVGLASSSASGFRVAATDGSVFAVGASFAGSMDGRPLAHPIVGIS